MARPNQHYFPGVARPMKDKVDYRFVNGWVDTGILPCREAFLAGLSDRSIDRPEGPFELIYPGLDGPNVDFSRFCHRPTLIDRAFRCELRIIGGGPARFRIATCGGVQIWLGTEKVASFEPFTRNAPQETEVSVTLPAGDATLTLSQEDLHERDTSSFFSLHYLDGPKVFTSLPNTPDPEALARTFDCLSNLRPDAVFRTEGTVALCLDDPPATPMTLTVSGLRPFMRGGLVDEPGANETRQIAVKPGQTAYPLFNVEDAPAGCLALDLTMTVGGASISRSLGVTNLPRPTALSGDLAARKRMAADLIARDASFDPATAALLAERGQKPRRVAAILDAVLPTVEDRYDCADFSILSLLRLWSCARDTLQPDQRDRLHAAFLGFRYWLDEPGNDVMWFWSENHVLCFHVAQYVAGGLFPDTVFSNSGKTGSALRSDAATRLRRWFDSIDTHGLCEWNSAAYYPIDILALLTLHDLESGFRDRCASVLDRILVMTGLHTSGGVPAGSQGRCYEKELLAGPVTELGTIAAIAFGGDFWTGYDRAAAPFCHSDYCPPPSAREYARPQDNTVLEARYTQGLDHAGELTLWKSRHGQLSSVTNLDPARTGHQAQIVDVQLSTHPMARLWINHPGDLKVWGERRPSLLAGNHVIPRIAQSGPTALLIYDLDQPWTSIAFTQVFAPPDAFDRIEQVAGWTVYSAGPAAAAIWCSRALEGVTGLYSGALRRAHGQKTGWVIALRRPEETEAEFTARLAASPPEFDETRLMLSASGDKGTQLELEHRGAFRVDGAIRAFEPKTSVPHVGRNGAPLGPWNDREDTA
jgi:hypothetical protein